MRPPHWCVGRCRYPQKCGGYRMESSRLSSFVQSPPGAQVLDMVIAVSPADTMRTAIESMSSAPGSYVLAVRDGHVAGTLTTRGAPAQCMDEQRIERDRPQDAAMQTANPRTCSRYTANAHAVGIMQKHGYRTLPVTHGVKQVGLVRAGEIRKNVAEAFPRSSSLNPCGRNRPLNHERVDSTGR